MSNLTLTLKKKWFDLIKSGEKKEEYREIKRHWTVRLKRGHQFKHFDIVTFVNGYSANSPRITVECLGIKEGKPNPEWCEDSDVDQTFYVIQLGQILE